MDLVPGRVKISQKARAIGLMKEPIVEVLKENCALKAQKSSYSCHEFGKDPRGRSETERQGSELEYLIVVTETKVFPRFGVNGDMEISIRQVQRNTPMIQSDRSPNRSWSFHLEGSIVQERVECGQIDDWSVVSVLLGYQEETTVEPGRRRVGDPFYRPLVQEGLNRLWERRMSRCQI